MKKLKKLPLVLFPIYQKLRFSYLLLKLGYKKQKIKKEKRSISVAITHYEKSSVAHLSLFNILNDHRISEIVILDDKSSDLEFEILKRKLKPFASRIKLYRRNENWGPFPNKLQAVSLCENEWVLLLDIDNTYPTRSIDLLYNLSEWESDTIYCPSRALPYFDYRDLIKEDKIDFQTVSDWTRSDYFNSVFLNTGNYFLNRDAFKATLRPYLSYRVFASDVIFVNYLWLCSGNKLKVVEGLNYLHTVGDTSTYLRTQSDSKTVSEPLRKRFEEMKSPEMSPFSPSEILQKSIAWQEPDLIKL